MRVFDFHAGVWRKAERAGDAGETRLPAWSKLALDRSHVDGCCRPLQHFPCCRHLPSLGGSHRQNSGKRVRAGLGSGLRKRGRATRTGCSRTALPPPPLKKRHRAALVGLSLSVFPPPPTSEKRPVCSAVICQSERRAGQRRRWIKCLLPPGLQRGEEPFAHQRGGERNPGKQHVNEECPGTADKGRGVADGKALLAPVSQGGCNRGKGLKRVRQSGGKDRWGLVPPPKTKRSGWEGKGVRRRRALVVALGLQKSKKRQTDAADAPQNAARRPIQLPFCGVCFFSVPCILFAMTFRKRR